MNIEETLDERKREGLLRSLKAVSTRNGVLINMGGKEYIDFSSNDYLGLASHPKLIEASKKAAEKLGAGSSASRLLSGSLELHHELEERTAEFKNKEAVLVFNSGYQANVGIISALYGKGDAIFSDRLNHASIIDGALLSGARIYRFNHNDLSHLESSLKKEREKFKNCLIVTETIFSMDGDRPLLKGLVELKEKYGCQLMVDEAHATGIYGKNGSGVAEEEGLSERIELVMGTFSKALGSFGAYLATSKEIKDFLINTCRSFIYSTALPPSVIAANLASLEVVKEEPFRRKKLVESASRFRKALKGKGFDVRGESQIVPLVLGDNAKTKAAASALQEKGHYVLPIRPPTVPQGGSRLRFSLSYNHDAATLQKLIDDIANIGI